MFRVVGFLRMFNISVTGSDTGSNVLSSFWQVLVCISYISACIVCEEFEPIYLNMVVCDTALACIPREDWLRHDTLLMSHATDCKPTVMIEINKSDLVLKSKLRKFPNPGPPDPEPSALTTIPRCPLTPRPWLLRDKPPSGRCADGMEFECRLRRTKCKKHWYWLSLQHYGNRSGDLPNDTLS